MEHPCINFTAVARSVRLLKVDGFSLTGSMGNNDCVKSRWSFDGYDWEIRIYPAVNCFVALEVALLSRARKGSVRAAIGFQVVDPRGLIKPSDELCVSCVFTDTQQCSPKKSFSGMGADVTFHVSGESFAAHKNILAARSPVFMAEFFGDMKEKCSPRVEIRDMEAAVFKALLHFIYTDVVAEFDEKDEAATVMAQHLLAAADRYGMDRLKLICEAKLSSGISVDTAATTLALAEQHNCPQLKAKCVRFIVKSPAVLDAVLATEGYRHLEASCPSVLADLLKSSLSMGGRADA
ncbi:unnamed protein product [Alopecurus aequalis]